MPIRRQQLCTEYGQPVSAGSGHRERVFIQSVLLKEEITGDRMLIPPTVYI